MPEERVRAHWRMRLPIAGAAATFGALVAALHCSSLPPSSGEENDAGEDVGSTDAGEDATAIIDAAPPTFDDAGCLQGRPEHFIQRSDLQ